MTGAELIAAERHRQVAVEGWTPEHDDEHGPAPLALAADSYANWREHKLAFGRRAGDPGYDGTPWPFPPESWPWSADWWKPKDYISDLVRAGALLEACIETAQRKRDLIAAEIDLLQSLAVQ